MSRWNVAAFTCALCVLAVLFPVVSALGGLGPGELTSCC